MQQLLLEIMCRLMVGDRYRTCFGQTDRCPVEAVQLSRRCTRRSPTRCGRNDEPGPTQHTAVVGETLFGDLTGSPATGPDGSCVQPLARSESDDFVGVDLNSAPDRRRSSVERKRAQDPARGLRDDRNAWLCL